MKIAVTDACIFIDLIEIDLISQLFKLGYDIHTSTNVYYELEFEQRQLLQAYNTVSKLTIHNLSGEELQKVNAEIVSKKLSIPDKTVIHIADKLNAMVLSSDNRVRKCSKKKHLEYHGLLWIFDKFIEQHIISKGIAIDKLKELMIINQYYAISNELREECKKRIKLWTNDI